MRSNYVTIRGVRIHYLVGGEGKPALFIHGHRSDAQRFKSLFQRISKKYKVYAPDLPGFGRSEKLPTTHSLENYFPYISDFVKGLNLDKFTLIGASMGVVLGNFLAMEMPRKIEKVIYLAPIFDRSSFKIPKFKYLPAIFLASAFPKSRFLVKLVNGIIRNDKVFKRFLKFFYPPEAQKPEILDYEIRQWRMMDIKVWAQTLGSLLTFRFPDKKVKIKAKAILIFPDSDQYLNIQKTIRSFAEFFPHYETIRVSGLNHMPKGEISQVLKNPKVKEILEKI